MQSLGHPTVSRCGAVTVTEQRCKKPDSVGEQATQASDGELHVLHPKRLHPIYSRFDVDTGTSARLNVRYDNVDWEA